MSNINVRKDDAAARVAQPQAQTMEWEPGRWMRSFLGWDPFREMAPFAVSDRSSFAPAFEIKEMKDAFLFRADVPGVKESDLEVHVSGSRLSISGKREAEKENKTDTYYAVERTYGSFTRSFTLPEGIDDAAIHADLRDGVLTVLVPKKPEAQPKKIPVSSQAAKA